MNLTPQGLTALCTKAFNEVTHYTHIFVLGLFLIKATTSTLSGCDLKSALRGSVVYFLLTLSFPFVLEILFEIPQAFLPNFSYDYSSEIQQKSETPNVNATASMPKFISYPLEVVLASLYWVAVFFHVLFMAIMSAMAPIVFLCACLLGIGLGINLFFGLIIIASSWPVMWYAFDQLNEWFIASGTTSFGHAIVELIIILLKGIGPLGLAYTSLQSGPGKSVISSAHKAIDGSVAGTQFIMPHAKGLAKAGLAKGQSLYHQYKQNRIQNAQQDLTPDSWDRLVAAQSTEAAKTLSHWSHRSISGTASTEANLSRATASNTQDLANLDAKRNPSSQLKEKISLEKSPQLMPRQKNHSERQSHLLPPEPAAPIKNMSSPSSSLSSMSVLNESNSPKMKNFQSSSFFLPSRGFSSSPLNPLSSFKPPPFTQSQQIKSVKAEIKSQPSPKDLSSPTNQRSQRAYLFRSSNNPLKEITR